MIISGRISALSPKPSEDAESYRKRAEPIARNPQALELMRLQFQGFVHRLRDALAVAMPTGTIEIAESDARIARPNSKAINPAEPASPASRNYDPYAHHYPASGGSMMLDAMIWSSDIASSVSWSDI